MIWVGTVYSDRIYHRPPVQTEKSQPVDNPIMPEAKCTKFTALSVDMRVGISWSASETKDRSFIAFLTLQDPVVQSIVSLSILQLYNQILNFFVEKMREAFALQKLLTFFQQKNLLYLEY